MNKLAIVMMLSFGQLSCSTIKHENDGPVVLPTYALLGCKSNACPGMWLGEPSGNALYPTQVTIDIDNSSKRGVIGIMATYDESVSMDDIQLSIDRHYSKWAFPKNSTSVVKLWRVESEKFAIQLSEDGGVKRVIYMAFAGKDQVFKDWVKSGAFGNSAAAPQTENTTGK